MLWNSILAIKEPETHQLIWACECLFRRNIEIYQNTIWVVEGTRIRIRYLREGNKPP